VSRWSDLFSAVSKGVTDSDTLRQSGGFVGSAPLQCRRVSLSVNGAATQNASVANLDPKVEKTHPGAVLWSERFKFAKALTDSDTLRHCGDELLKCRRVSLSVRGLSYA